MRITKMVLAVVLIGLLQSCADKERVTQSGLKYTVIREGVEEVAPKNHYLLLNMIYKDDTDSVWIDTNERGIPMVIFKEDSLWKTNNGSIQEVFVTLRKGDSVKFEVTAADLFSKTWNAPLPRQIKPETIVTFLIGVQDVLNNEELDQWQQAMMGVQQQKAQEAASAQLAIDKEILNKYLEENGIETTETESGLRYVITQTGSGETPSEGQSVSVNYTGKVLSGEFFDSSIKEIAEKEGIYNAQREPYEPIEFALGTGAVIQGWDEGISLLNVGSKATFYIPSTLAYGPRARSEKIPANSILVFDVELVAVK